MRNAKSASVYVMASAGRAKIGRSATPEARRNVLWRSGAPDIRIVLTTPLRDDASYVEAAAHRLLEGKRLDGEWFGVTEAEAIAAVHAAIVAIEARKDAIRCQGCQPQRLPEVVPGIGNTSFARWRRKMDLTQEQASRLLGVTLRTVQHWESGKTAAGADSAPSYPIRIAMAALARSPGMEPWPEEEAKVIPMRRRK